MKIIVTIDTGNGAFEHFGMYSEVNRILKEVPQKLFKLVETDLRGAADLATASETQLFDSIGSICGSLIIERP